MGSAPYPRGWSVGGAIQVVRLIVIAYVALFIFALVGYFLTTVLPWFLRVVVPVAVGVALGGGTLTVAH